MSAVDASGGTAAAVDELAKTVESGLQGTELGARAATIRARLEGPLRVAIAGRVKVGKSTLLNALVGERLAPTDAGECTRVVAEYRRGQGRQIQAVLHDGGTRPLVWRRSEGALDIELDGVSEDDIGYIDVEWPTSALAEVSLIDTPGLGSLRSENSRRTQEFLEPDSPDADGGADAVIYLMRHLHRVDVEFLGAFMDRSITAASPVNSVGVLARADEIGAGRLDAMESAGRIAERYRHDEQIRTLCSTVLPLAGLLAETGLTLREDETKALRDLLTVPDEQLETMLLSGDHFCDMSASNLTVEARRALLERFGLYGIRISLAEIRGGANTAAALAPRLVEHSGLQDLRNLLTDHFGPRGRLLQARSALLSLRNVARELRDTNPELASTIGREAERIETTSVDFTRLRAAHLVTSATVKVSDADRSVLERLLMATTPTDGLGLDPGSSPDVVAKAALDAISHWRRSAGDPLASPAVVEVYEAAARVCEAIYATSSRPAT
jgi:50S ribosome-binding GTPase